MDHNDLNSRLLLVDSYILVLRGFSCYYCEVFLFWKIADTGLFMLKVKEVQQQVTPVRVSSCARGRDLFLRHFLIEANEIPNEMLLPSAGGIQGFHRRPDMGGKNKEVSGQGLGLQCP